MNSNSGVDKFEELHQKLPLQPWKDKLFKDHLFLMPVGMSNVRHSMNVKTSFLV